MVVTVTDQPLLTAAVLTALVGRFRAGATLVAARYRSGTVGVPALFTRPHLPALQSLSGDRGARALLAGDELTTVAFADGDLDIDTPEALADLGEN